MSVDLDIRVDELNFTVKELRDCCMEILSEIAPGLNVPQLDIKIMEEGERLELDIESNVTLDTFLCAKFSETDNEIYVLFTEVPDPPPPYYDPSDEEAQGGIWAGVVVHGIIPVTAFLAAGMGLALSKLTGNRLYDEWGHWSRLRISDYDTFFNNVKLASAYDNISSACEDFGAHLPGFEIDDTDRLL